MYPTFPMEKLSKIAIEITDWIFDEANVPTTARTLIEDSNDYAIVANHVLEDLQCELSGHLMYRAIQKRKELKSNDRA